MKNKSDLKRKVLCSLLAASTMGIFYSSAALAAQVNGVEKKDGVITNEFLTGEAGSCKVVVGHGSVSIQTNATVGEVLNNYQTGGLDAALAPSNDGKNVPVTGVIGGEVKITESAKLMLKIGGAVINEALGTNLFSTENLAKLDTITPPATDNMNQNVTVTIGGETSNPVVLGSINGDLLIVGVTDNETLTKNGNIEESVNSGNVIVDIGGSAAVSIMGGEGTTIVNGNVDKEITGDTNVGIYANGGLATSLMGGNASSIVNGNTSIDINTTTDKSKIDALTFGVAGGGAALNINGDSATSNVNGTTYIGVGGNGTAVGIVGGGVAVSYDMSGDGASGSDKKAAASTGKSTIVVDLDGETDSVEMQKALGAIKEGGLSGLTSNLQGLVGQSAAIGVTGGGIALANDKANNTATATTAGSDIYLVDGYGIGVFGNGIAAATNNAKATTEMTDALTINVGKEMEAVGVFGNGLAMFGGTSNGGTDNLSGLASVTATDTTINIKGKVDGVINGGLAIDDSQSDTTNAVVNTSGTATINVYDGAAVEVLNFDGLKPLAGAPNDKKDSNPPDLGSYTFAVEAAVKDVAIAAGGVAVGGGAESTVKDGVVNIYGGEVTGDVLAGGVAVYGEKGADEKAVGGANMENATLNLNGGTITGNVYAGGATVNDTYSTVADDNEYTSATATVDKAVINLAGTEVTGEIVGAGYSINDVSYTEPTGTQTIGTNNIGEKVLAADASESTLNLKAENTLKALESNSKIHHFDFINAEAGSVTKVEGLNNNTALIDATGTKVTVDGSAKLDITALAANGTEYKVISTDGNTAAEDKADDTFWTDSSLLYDRTAGYAHGEGQAEGNYNVVYEEITDANVDEATDDFVDAIGDNGEEIRNNIEGLLKDPRNTFSGFDKFMEDASTSGNYADVGKMAMIGEAAGVTSNTIDVAGDMADNSVLRLSFTQDDITGEPKVNEDGAIWAKYIHNKHDLDGMASSFGSVDSSSDFDGATIGVDFAKKGKVQSGIAFSYGSGDSHGMGINNDFDMWGVSLYGNVKNDDTNVIADIGFSESDNELTGTAMGKDIKADRDVSAFTVGVRAEKLYTNGSTQIVPYTGLRYYNVDPDSYTAYYDGQKFGEYDADRQNIWTLPVGVSLRNETVTENGWRLTPKVDVAYIWAFGDTDNSFDLNTGSGVDTLDYTVMDSGSWLGSVGFEAGKDDWAFGVGYSYQKGSHEEANKWFVNVEYSF